MKSHSVVYCVLVSILGVLALSISASAQVYPISGTVRDQQGNVIPGATVIVLSGNLSNVNTATQPGSPLATIYSDPAGTMVINQTTNPATTSGTGQYVVYAASGSYVMQVYRNGYQLLYVVSLASGSGSGCQVTGSANALLKNNGSSGCSNSLVSDNGALTTIGDSAAITGPRPYIDVTAVPYNAKGDGVTDDTAAIQSAITAACSYSDIGAYKPGVFFPPGYYKVSQPQTPSTSAVFTTCANLYLYGNGSQALNGQFEQPPMGAAIVVSAGSSPNLEPVFLLSQTSGMQVTFENLTIVGYNQAVWIQSSNFVHLTNDYLIAANTGQSNNTPLRISNSFWVWITSGGIQSTGTVPCGIWSDETPLGSEAPTTGLIFVLAAPIWSCSGFKPSTTIPARMSSEVLTLKAW